MHVSAGDPWRMRLFYLGFFGASGIYFPYVGLYFKAIHLDGAQIGLLASLPPLAGALLPALWGGLSDRYGWRNRIVRASLMAGTVIAPLIPLLHPFGLLLVVVVALAVALSPAIPLADAATLESLQGTRGSFGAVRLFGSIGFLLSSIVLGQVFAGRHILWMFPIYGAALGAALLAAFVLPAQTGRERAARGEGVRFVLRDPRLGTFLVLVLVGYTAFAAYNTFFPLYLQDRGAGTAVVGVATALATLSELPGMAVAGPAMRRLGVKPVLLIALGSCCLRWLAYAAIHDYRWALLVQPLHSLGFGAFYVAGVAYVDTIVPARLRATGQTLFSMSFFGLSAVVGANLFGILYDRLGGGIFAVAAALVVPAWLGLLALVPNVRPVVDGEAPAPDGGPAR